MAQDMRLAIRINADGTAAIRVLRQVDDQLEDVGDEAGRADGRVGALGSALGSLGGTLAGLALGAGFVKLGEDMVRAEMDTARYEASLKAVMGSSEAAGEELNYVTGVAMDLGISLEGAATTYTSLAAAAKGTTLEGQASRDIFEAVSLVMAKLRRSSEETEGALKAVEQMISKGRVAAEELRGQLGERLPGAFQLAAEAMGVTTIELDKMLSAGEVMAADMLPKLARRLEELYDDGDAISGLSAEWNRLGTEMGNFYTAVNRVLGLNAGLERMLRTMRELVGAVTAEITDTIPGGLAIAAGRWSQPLADVNQRITVVKLRLQELRKDLTAESATQMNLGLKGGSGEEIAQLEADLARLNRERQQYLELAAKEASIAPRVAVLTSQQTKATEALTDAERRHEAQLQKEAAARSRWTSQAAYALGLDEQHARVLADLGETIDGVAEHYATTRERVAALLIEQTGLNTVSAATGAAIEIVRDAAGGLSVAIGAGFDAALNAGAAAEKQLKDLVSDGLTPAGRKADAWAKQQQEAAKAAAAALKLAQSEVAGLIQQYLPAKAAAQELAAAQAALGTAGGSLGLTETDSEQIIAGLTRDLREENIGLAKSYDTAWAAQERFALDQADVEQLLAEGKMTAEEYADALDLLTLKGAAGSSALAAYFAKVKEEYEGIGGLVADVGDTIKDNLSDALAEGKLDMESLLTSLRNKLADFAVDAVWDQIASAFAKSVASSSASSSSSWIGKILSGAVGALFGGTTSLFQNSASIPMVGDYYVPMPAAASGWDYVTGPGTTTSDSIPAFLSLGEGIVNARGNAANPGAVAFMNRGGRVRGYASGSDYIGAPSSAGGVTGAGAITVDNRLSVQVVNAYGSDVGVQASGSGDRLTIKLVKAELARSLLDGGDELDASLRYAYGLSRAGV